MVMFVNRVLNFLLFASLLVFVCGADTREKREAKAKPKPLKFVYSQRLRIPAGKSPVIDCDATEFGSLDNDTCYFDDVEVTCVTPVPNGTLISRPCPAGRNRYNSGIALNCFEGQWYSPSRDCVPECGNSTKGNDFPWMVAIYNKTDDLICAGTIISGYHMITSLKCFYPTQEKPPFVLKDLDDYLIIAGRHSINIHKPGTSLQKRKIRSLLPIPKRDTIDFDRDLAIVIVDKEFEFYGTDGVNPVCLDWEFYYDEIDLKDGNAGFSVGWQYDGADVVPCQLGGQSNVVYWLRNTCLRNIEIIQKSPASAPNDVICSEHIARNTSTCGKDLGSGLVFKSHGDRYFLRGVLQRVHNIANNYLFYTKVSNFYEQLRQLFTDHALAPTYFHTVEWDSPRNSVGCTLPKNVENGKFSLNSAKTYVEGKWVPPLTTILLTCDDSSGRSPFSLRCIKNVWTPSIEKVSCRKPGTCPTIPATTSEKVICKLDGVTVSCQTPPSNTTALVRCNSFHTYPGIRPIYKCQNEEWDQAFTSCTLECGIKRVGATELILGGKYAVENEYPWVVGIYNSSNQQICGGTLISRKFVLSAAHCFTSPTGDLKDKNDFTILAGKYYRDVEIQEPFTQIGKIKAIHLTDNYRGRDNRYRADIVLIEVVESFVATREVEPICVDWENTYDDYDLTEDTEGVVAGWGFTTEGGDPSPALKKLTVPFRNKRDCVENLPSKFSEEFLINDKFCAGYKDNNTNVCQGDSGGGLYFKSDGTRFFIRGIISISMGTEAGCDSNHYALYTKVSTYLKWIESKTRRVL